MIFYRPQKFFCTVVLFVFISAFSFAQTDSAMKADASKNAVPDNIQLQAQTTESAGANIGETKAEQGAVANQPGGNEQKSKEADNAGAAVITAGAAAAMAESAPKNPEEKVKQYDIKRVQDSKELKKQQMSILKELNKEFPGIANFLKKPIFGVRPILFISAVALFAVVWLFQHFLLGFVFKLFARKNDDLKKKESRAVFLKLQGPISWMLLVLAAYFSLIFIVEHDVAIIIIGRITTVLTILIFFWGLEVISLICFKVAEIRVKFRYAETKNLFNMGRQLVRYSLILICFICILGSQGVDTAALLASLGIGGAALAFASKDTIANFFGSISLIIDRPFVVGDWIVTLGTEGIVENVGLRSTRIRTFPKSVVTIPNNVLANANIENWSRRPKRRTEIVIGLSYSTMPEQMEAIIADFKKILLGNPRVEHDGIRVNFTTFNASSLDIKLVFFVLEVDSGAYTDIVEQINLEIMRAINARGLSMAFPSTSIYVESLPSISANPDSVSDVNNGN